MDERRLILRYLVRAAHWLKAGAFRRDPEKAR